MNPQNNSGRRQWRPTASARYSEERQIRRRSLVDVAAFTEEQG
jgi:hypothetical protein